MKLTIGRLAKTCEVSVETIRFYQRLELLAIPQAISNTYREYGEEHVQQLLFIRRAQLAGFTLNEIKMLMELHPFEDRLKIQTIAKSRLEALEARIHKLQQVSKGLQQLIAQCEDTAAKHACPIIKAFNKD